MSNLMLQTAGMMGRRVGGAPYLPSCFSAFEFNETTGPAIDAISGQILTLGALQTLSGGELRWDGTTSSTLATSSNTDIQLAPLLPFSLEVYVMFTTSGLLPTISGVRSSLGGVALQLSTLGGYSPVTFGGTGKFDIKPDDSTAFVLSQYYHIVMTFDGGATIGPAGFTFYIDRVKFPSITGSATPTNVIDVNTIGHQNGNFSVGAGNLKFERRYSAQLTDAEAFKLYDDRDVL